ncbi:MAG: RNA polymerase [Thermoplasmata archaeon]
MRKYLTLAEVKEYLDAEANTRELGKFSSTAREHATTFSKVSKETAVEIVKKIMESGIQEEYAVKVADLLPSTPEEVRAIFQKEMAFDENTISTVLSIVKKYTGKE